jgi:ribosomal protein S18 acetylase RimI-like enzyme
MTTLTAAEVNLDEATQIRGYLPEDRTAVRQISYDTGMMGDSIASQWRDLDSWADINTGYYLDHEPESTQIATVGSKVVGYLLGCVDSGKVDHPGLLGAKAVLPRGLLFRPGTAGVLWKHAGDAIKDTALLRVDPRGWCFADSRWPAHFHLNFTEEARGRGLGSAMVQNWLDQLRELGVPGCHLETQTEGFPTPTMAFLERQGFRAVGKPALVPGVRSLEGNRLYNQVMIQSL